MRCAFWLIILTLCALAAHAQDTVGLLRGSLTYDAGGPATRMPVTITIGEKTVSFTSDMTGAFSGIVPAGTGVAKTSWSETPVTITAGEVNRVVLVITPNVGAVVRLTYPDGSPYLGPPSSSMARSPASPLGRFVSANPIGPGQFWLPEVKPEDTALAVRINLRGSYMHGNTVLRFNFANAEPLRRIAGTVPASPQVLITLQDDAGQPLVDVPVVGRVSRWNTADGDIWAETLAPRRIGYFDAQLRWLNRVERTDLQGTLDLGNMVPNTYTLTIGTDTLDGPRVTLEVKEDGTYTPTVYTLRTTRPTVTQTLFRPDGTPAKSAEVFASFCQGGRVVIRKATTDAHGRVTWANLPHRPVIVSGMQVAPGVIPPDGTAFPAQLPAPQPGAKRTFHMEPRVDGTSPVTFGYTFLHTGGVYVKQQQAQLNRQITGSVRDELVEMAQGTPLTYGWGATFTPTQVRLLAGAYLPYVDPEVEQIDLPLEELPLTSYTGMPVKGRVLDAAGRRAPDGVMVEILPAKGNPLLDVMTLGKLSWVLQPKQVRQGAFTVSLPPCGPYEVRVRTAGTTFKTAHTFTLTPETAPTDAIVITLPE